MTIDITQQEADSLFKMSKHYTGNDQFSFPSLGGTLRIDLLSDDAHEKFSLDITQGKISLSKHTFQNRARTVIILARLDIGGSPHRNPDGEEVPCSHLHLFKQGFGDKWAIPLPDIFLKANTPSEFLEIFMDYCNITTKPIMQKEVFQ